MKDLIKKKTFIWIINQNTAFWKKQLHIKKINPYKFIWLLFEINSKNIDRVTNWGITNSNVVERKFNWKKKNFR